MSLRNWKSAAAVLLGGAAIFAGSGSAEAGQDIVVKRFLLGRLAPNTLEFVATGGRGTTNAYRDNAILLVFSGPVNFSSIDNRTVKIGIPAGGLFVGAEGAFYQYVTYRLDEVSGSYVEKRRFKNRVIFDPTKSQSPESQRNPYGFESSAQYTVTVPGLDSGTTKTIRTPGGDYLNRTFSTTFTTTDKYLQDYAAPSIVKVEASDAPGVPLQGRVNVDSRADIIAYFSEPMLPSTFDPNTTFTVFNQAQNRLVSGTIRPSPDGTVFTFRPALGYGRGPFNITVNLATTLTDRSGNALDRGRTETFTSEFDQFAPNYDEQLETFDTVAQEDTAFIPPNQRARWNVLPQSPGLLQSVFGSQYIEIQYTNSGGHGIPWWNAQAHTQQLYPNANVGNTARTVSGFHWRYYTATVVASALYNNTTVQLGHNTSGSVNTNFTGSFSDTPVTVVNSASYNMDTSAIEWIPGPTFTANWPYNGQNNVVLDINVPNGGTQIRYWRYFTATGSTTHIRAYSGAAAQGLTWGHDIRIHFLTDKSEAQSRWYDTGVNSPNFSDPIVIQTIPAGCSTLIEYQGAFENPFIPGTADTSTVSIWTTDPAVNLSGYRFFRFRVAFQANVSTQSRPFIDEIKLPFIYY